MPVWTRPHSDLNRIDVSYPYRDAEIAAKSVKKEVVLPRSEHLDDGGEVKEKR